MNRKLIYLSLLTIVCAVFAGCTKKTNKDFFMLDNMVGEYQGNHSFVHMKITRRFSGDIDTQFFRENANGVIRQILKISSDEFQYRDPRQVGNQPVIPFTGKSCYLAEEQGYRKVIFVPEEDKIMFTDSLGMTRIGGTPDQPDQITESFMNYFEGTKVK